MLCGRDIEAPNPASFVPAGDVPLRYRWGRIVGHAAALLRWEPFAVEDAPRDARTEMQQAGREATLLLASSPVLQAPICFEHAQAAANVARELTTSWLDRALGYRTGEVRGVRTAQDARLLRGIVSQGLIGVFCANGG
ncbi:MAG: hypothetical protein ACLP0J_05300 [Solirubrobacteraceae bacterium]